MSIQGGTVKLSGLPSSAQDDSQLSDLRIDDNINHVHDCLFMITNEQDEKTSCSSLKPETNLNTCNTADQPNKLLCKVKLSVPETEFSVGTICLWDTGAMNSYISEQYLNSSGLASKAKIQKISPKSVKLAVKSSKVAIDKKVQLTVTVGTELRTVWVNVCPDLIHSFIAGLSLMKELEINIDIAHNMLLMPNCAVKLYDDTIGTLEATSDRFLGPGSSIKLQVKCPSKVTREIDCVAFPSEKYENLTLPVSICGVQQTSFHIPICNIGKSAIYIKKGEIVFNLEPIAICTQWKAIPNESLYSHMSCIINSNGSPTCNKSLSSEETGQINARAILKFPCNQDISTGNLGKSLSNSEMTQLPDQQIYSSESTKEINTRNKVPKVKFGELVSAQASINTHSDNTVKMDMCECQDSITQMKNSLNNDCTTCLNRQIHTVDSGQCDDKSKQNNPTTVFKQACDSRADTYRQQNRDCSKLIPDIACHQNDQINSIEPNVNQKLQRQFLDRPAISELCHCRTAIPIQSHKTQKIETLHEPSIEKNDIDMTSVNVDTVGMIRHEDDKHDPNKWQMLVDAQGDLLETVDVRKKRPYGISPNDYNLELRFYDYDEDEETDPDMPELVSDDDITETDIQNEVEYISYMQNRLTPEVRKPKVKSKRRTPKVRPHYSAQIEIPTNKTPRQIIMDSLNWENTVLKTEEEKEKLIELLLEMRDSLSLSDFEIGCHKYIEASLDTIDPKLTHIGVQYRLSPKEMILMQKEVAKMVRLGIVVPNTIPQRFSNSAFLVSRKNGSARVILDMRFFNRNLKSLAMRPIDIHDLFASLGNICDSADDIVYSSCDFKNFFNQIPVRSSDTPFLSFNIGAKSYRWTRLAFGISTAPAWGQRVMDNLIQDLPNCVSFLDDVLIFSKKADCLRHLRSFLTEVSKVGMRVSVEKSIFCTSRTTFLGFDFRNGVYGLTEKNTRCIQALKPPHDVPTLRSFLGHISYWRGLISNTQIRLAPLYKKLKRNYGKYDWTKEDQAIFDSLKKDLTSDPVLGIPLAGSKRELWCDASESGVAGVVIQHYDVKQPDGTIIQKRNCLGYTSRVLSKSEKNYGIARLELTSVAHSLKWFKVFLFLEHFKLYLDSTVVSSWLKSPKPAPSKHVCRLLEYISTFSFDVVRCGTAENIADFFSRAADEKTPILGQFPLENENNIYYDPEIFTISELDGAYKYIVDTEDDEETINAIENDDSEMTCEEDLMPITTRSSSQKSIAGTRSQPSRQAKSQHRYIQLPGRKGRQDKIKVTSPTVAEERPTTTTGLMPPPSTIGTDASTSPPHHMTRTIQASKPSPIGASTPLRSRIPRLIGTPMIQDTPTNVAATQTTQFPQPTATVSEKKKKKKDETRDVFVPSPHYGHIPPLANFPITVRQATIVPEQIKPKKTQYTTPLHKTIEKYYSKPSPTLPPQVWDDKENAEDFYTKEQNLFPPLHSLFSRLPAIRYSGSDRTIPPKIIRDVQTDLHRNFKCMWTRKEIISEQKADKYLGLLWKYLCSGQAILSRNSSVARWTFNEAQFFIACD